MRDGEGGGVLEFSLGQGCLSYVRSAWTGMLYVRMQLFLPLVLVASSSFIYSVAMVDGVLLPFRQPSRIPAEKLIVCCRCRLSH